MRYTVTYTQDALDALARQWIAARNQASMAHAGDEIDRILSEDAPQRGCKADRGFRQLIVAPLIVEFIVEDDDRKVVVWSVRHVGELANGH